MTGCRYYHCNNLTCSPLPCCVTCLAKAHCASVPSASPRRWSTLTCRVPLLQHRRGGPGRRPCALSVGALWDLWHLSHVGRACDLSVGQEVQEAPNPEMAKVREKRAQVPCWAGPSAIGMCPSPSSQLLSKKRDSPATGS